MNLKAEQLGAHLKDGLQPIYIVQGDEPLQHMECADLIRRHAKQAGYLSREVFYVEKGFDWSELMASTQSMSLFSELRLIELRLGNGKIGETGAKIITQLVQDPPQDTVLLVLADKPDKSVNASKWFKRLQEVAVVIQVWPLSINQMPVWLQKRAAAINLQLTREAAQLLAQRSEGNLLAASQELEKIHLLSLSRQSSAAGDRFALDVDEVWQFVADNARYDVFALTDAALAGQVARSKRILNGLLAEQAEPVIILWSLAREIRNLLAMQAKLSSGMAINQVLQQSGVWAQRKNLLANALQRLNGNQLENLLVRCHEIDKTIKGMGSGQLRDDLLNLVLGLAGLRLPQVAAMA